MNLLIEEFNQALLYKEDGTLWWKTSGKGRKPLKPIGSLHNEGYLQMTFKRTQYKVHRVIWLLHYGEWPRNQLDHINGDKSDNRIENLREGASINQHNRNMPLPSSGIIGAHWNKKRKCWWASIRDNGKSIYLGRFNTAEEASNKYLEYKNRILNV